MSTPRIQRINGLWWCHDPARPPPVTLICGLTPLSAYNHFRRIWPVVVALMLALASTGCIRKVYIDRPVPYEVVRQVVVPVDAALTAHPTEIPEGGIRHCPLVAGQRKGLLEQAWAQLDAIRLRHGDTSPRNPTE